MKNKCRRVLCAVLALIMVVLMGGCKIGNTEYVLKEKPVAEDVLFTFNDVECKLSEAMIYVANYKNLYGTAYEFDLWEGDFDNDELESYIKDIALAEIERIYAIDALALENEIALTESELAEVQKVADEYYTSLTADEIAYMGATLEGIALAYEHYALALKVYELYTADDGEEVSDDEARVLTVQIIHVTDADTAETVASKVSDPDSFETVAATYSDARTIEVHMARGDYPEEVEEIAFSLEEGDVSGMIETDDGFYFVKCIDKFDEELTDQNKEVIRMRKQQAEFNEKYESVKEKAVFHLNTDLWNSVKVNTEYEVYTSSFFGLY